MTRFAGLIPTLVLSAVFVLAITGCGGGGGSNEAITSQSTGGEMTLLITDAETDRFNEILVTLEEAMLIPANGNNPPPRQILFDEPITIDLRELTDFSEFLSRAEVEEGTYTKLRLIVDEVQLSELDENGNILDRRTVDIPSGKIDLNPRQDFVIAPGENEVVLIDFDADNSFKVVETGTGELKFRPVVFITLVGDDDDEGDEDDRLVRQRGQITSLDFEESTFDLCALEMASAGDTDMADVDECVAVEFDDEETSVFADGTTAGTTDDLVENSEAIVIGEVERDDEGMMIEAVAVVMGDIDSLIDVKGTVATEVSTEGTFAFTTESGQGLAETLTVALQENSIIFERDGGDRMEPDELEIGAKVTVFGASDNEVADRFNAISVAVAENDDDEEEVEGTITSVDGSTMTVSEEDNGITLEACVVLQDNTTIQINRDTGESELVEEGTAADLAAGMEIEAKGNVNADGCVTAELMIVEIENEEVGGTIAAIDNDTLTVTLDDDQETAQACVRFDSDTVVEIRDEEGEVNQLGTPDDLATGMEIEASGVIGADGCIEADVIVIEDSQDSTG